MAETKKSKSRRDEQAQLLDLLRAVLPKIAPDPALANQVHSFQKFCEHIELPDLEPKTVEDVKQHFVAGFGEADLEIVPDEDGKGLNVDVSLPDGSQFHNHIPVRPVAPDAGEEQEVTLKYVAFPVALPGDPELTWALAKRENLTNDEAAMALTKIEEDFWASKTGQKLLRYRVERSFPEFIGRVPAGVLSESGLKRHYKLPETVKVLRAAHQKRG